MRTFAGWGGSPFGPHPLMMNINANNEKAAP